jgi:hypothetical protein
MKMTSRAILSLTLLSLFFSSPSHSNALNQNAANEAAARTQRRGSDQSMVASNNSAMRAVMNLATLNIPGAFSNGYRAYGEYINSEKLDSLEARNLKEQSKYTTLGVKRNTPNSGGPGSLPSGSGGSSAVKALAPSAQAPNAGGTTFSRLDPSFLYEGETDGVAAEFEKKSGMKRETFLKHIASATDSDIHWNDPNLMAKLEARFQAFVADVPNPEFRSGLQRAASLFPSGARIEVLQKLAGFYQDANKSWNGSDGSSQLAEKNLSSGKLDMGLNADNDRSPASQEGHVVAATSSLPAESSSTEALTKANPARGASLYIGLRADAQTTLQDFLPSDQKEESIFQIINKKYRQLTPLFGKTLMQPSP